MVRKVKKKTIISIDLDGVLASYEEGWQGSDVIGDPIEGAREVLLKLNEMGFTLVVNTVRGNLDLLTKWFGENFSGVKAVINEPIWNPPSTSNKIFAHVYIDDRNIENLDENGEPRNYNKGAWNWVLKKLTVLFTEEKGE